MKKIYVILFCLIALTSRTTAQEVVQDAQAIKALTKQNAEAIKALKKTYNLKKVSIEQEENGKWHYIVIGKSGYTGVVDAQGKMIIEPQYDFITYIPALNEGLTNYRSKYTSLSSDIYHTSRPALFKAEKVNNNIYGSKRDGCELGFTNITIYNCDGQKLVENIDLASASFPGYMALGTNSVFPESRYARIPGLGKTLVGLMTSTGEVILEPVYDEIVFDQKVLTFKRTVDGVEKHGGLLLDNPSEQVPAIYETCQYNEGKWEVRLNKNSLLEEYKPSTNLASVSYRDDGERYFDQEKYDDVIKYYAEHGATAPWAKFFTARALVEKATAEVMTKRLQFDYNVNVYQEAEIPFIDWTLAYNQLKTAKILAEAYLQEDKTYEKQARWCISDCEMYMNMLDKQEPQKEYQATIDHLRQLRAAAYERQQQQLAERQRQAAAFSNIMSGMMSNILGSIGGNSSGSYNSSRKQSVSSGVSSSGSSSSSANNRGNESSTPTRHTCSRCKGTGKIVVENSLSGGYGLEKKMKTCPECGKTYDSFATGHRHDRCSSCHGTGYYEIK